MKKQKNELHYPIDAFLEYIEKAFGRTQCESIWIDDLGDKTIVDVGYASHWWFCCMLPELKRVFGDGKSKCERGG